MSALATLTPGVAVVPKPGVHLTPVLDGINDDAPEPDSFTRLVVIDPDAGTAGHALVELATLGGGPTYLADPADLITIVI